MKTILKALCSFYTVIFLFSNACAHDIQRVPQQKQEIQLTFAPLVKQVTPAVVNVYAAKQVRVRSPFADDPFFEQFFGRVIPNQPTRTQSSLGSGVIVDPSGLIVTNYHVIRGADEIKVALSDGREFESKVMLKDEATDIAVLKIDAKGAKFPVLTLGNSDSVEVGDLVLAIGNPFGVGQTVTSGIVSAQARTRVGISDFDFFIQTDAAINPGNSGGALVDMKGELIGINTAIYSRSGGSVGIGFAIPANLVRAVVAAVKRGNNTFDPPYIGASFQVVTPDVAESLGMAKPYGALVTAIDKNSPSQKAGLNVGDVVIAADGMEINNPDTLGYRLMTTGVGHKMQIQFLRNNVSYDTTLDLVIVPQSQIGRPEQINGSSPFAGAKLMNLTPQISRRFHLQPNVSGVVVSQVDAGSNASALFQPGDIIQSVNNNRISTINDLKSILTLKTPDVWRLEYQRNGMLIRQYIR